MTSYTIGIAGSGGDGVILLGELLVRTAAQAGLHCFLTKSFGPQIRGGETSCRLTVADPPLHCPGPQVDLLAILGWEGLAQFQRELRCAPDAVVLCDARQPPRPELLDSIGVDTAAGVITTLPLEQLALERAGSKQARNMALGGVLCAALGWPVEAFAAQLRQRLARRGDSELDSNAVAALAGAEVAASAAIGLPRPAPALPTAGAALELRTGNQAVCDGALAGGCRFMAGYPISPATEILEAMARELPLHGGSCVQAEDEIAAAGLALGASYGGTRALTATSGPGFSLKTESLGLAVMAELPLVVVDVQRVGPSTGIPTRSEQGDLNLALYGRHGDAPCAVLAPVSIADCAELTQAAFEIATEYRTPVVLLSDQYLAQGVQTVDSRSAGLQPASQEPLIERRSFDPRSAGLQPASQEPLIERRSADEPVAEPPRPLPASLSGLERDSAGEPSSDPQVHAANCARRAAKFEALRLARPLAAHYDPGLPSADPAHRRSHFGILTWGSSYGPCCALADALALSGRRVSVFAPRLIYPLPTELLTAWWQELDQLFVPELNHSGQFWHYLRSQLDLPVPATPYHRAGGAAFTVEELVQAIGKL